MVAYIVGGFTFIPLVVIVTLLLAWYLAPKHETNTTHTKPAAVSLGVAGEAKSQELGHKTGQQLSGAAAASGTFAVLRRYDFQAATAALSARNNAGSNGIANATPADGSIGNDASTSSSSESVYQVMYRSVFDRNKNNNNTRTLLADSTADQNPSVKPGKSKGPPANVFYIVLRHGHLMLYDSPAQVEVKHVISLAHHAITLQAGNGAFPEDNHSTIPEADLFVKRTAIVLTPTDIPNGALQQANEQPPTRPIVLFGSLSIEKEDFYHALLASRASPPTPLELDPAALIKLQSTLHSSSLTPETKAVNALLGRIFLALQHSDFLSNFIRRKIENKLARIQKPSFIPLVEIRSLDLGDAGPVISNLRLKDLDISGDLSTLR